MKKPNQSTFLVFLNQFMQGAKLFYGSETVHDLSLPLLKGQELKQKPCAHVAEACSKSALKTSIISHGSYKHKQIHTVFRANIIDQKRRAQFAKLELQKIVMQTLTTIDASVNVPSERGTSVATKTAEASHCFESLSAYKVLGPSLRLQKPISQKFALKKGSFTKLRNRCILTGRSTIVGKFRLSRIRFRNLAHYALIPGLTKRTNH